VTDDEPAAAAGAAGAADVTGLVLDSHAAGDAGLYAAAAGDDECDGRSKHTRLGRRTVSVLSTSTSSSPSQLTTQQYLLQLSHIQVAFSALTLLAGHQEEHPVHKK